MKLSEKLEAFSAYRLGGEPIPHDVRALLEHTEELASRTGIELNWTKGWSPWADTGYLNAEDLADADIKANIRAISDVCAQIAFVAENQEGEYFGYWRGFDQRSIAESSLVYLDNEGSFQSCSGSSFAEAILGAFYDDDEFAELRGWLQSLGIAVIAESADELAVSDDEPTAEQAHIELCDRYRR